MKCATSWSNLDYNSDIKATFDLFCHMVIMPSVSGPYKPLWSLLHMVRKSHFDGFLLFNV